LNVKITLASAILLHEIIQGPDLVFIKIRKMIKLLLQHTKIFVRTVMKIFHDNKLRIKSTVVNCYIFIFNHHNR